MGLLDMFKKADCGFCGTPAGPLSRTKLADGTIVCTACERRCSAWFDLFDADRPAVERHMSDLAAMTAFADAAARDGVTFPSPTAPRLRDEPDPLSIVTFYDGIGMFEAWTERPERRVVRELFRYDKVQRYDLLLKQHRKAGDDDPVAAKRIGLTITVTSDAHPGLTKLELPLQERVLDHHLQRRLDELNALADRFDAVFGIVPVAALASQVTQSIFGVPHLVGRIVGPEHAERVAAWTAVADAALARELPGGTQL